MNTPSILHVPMSLSQELCPLSSFSTSSSNMLSQAALLVVVCDQVHDHLSVDDAVRVNSLTGYVNDNDDGDDVSIDDDLAEEEKA